MKNILVTGGAGFIGSNFIHYVFEKTGYTGNIVNLDKLTYAGNLENLADIVEKYGGRYTFVKGDICDYELVKSLFAKYKFDRVVHFAAESHVDRSIFGPKEFINTNINGTFTLLEAARDYWNSITAEKDSLFFHHISTDEVYGSLGKTGKFQEITPYSPHSPYSASKAASDHLVRAYHDTYGLPATISNCSNNYGPYHFPEKLIPLIILNALDGKSLPVYGDGMQVRDWLFVEDHCSAIWNIITKGKSGETYNIGGNCEMANIDVVKTIISILEQLRPSKDNKALNGKKYDNLITYVTDRPGHDRRYAIDFSKINRELGWKPSVDFKQGILDTVKWYLENKTWTDNVRSGAYREWINKNYNR